MDGWFASTFKFWDAQVTSVVPSQYISPTFFFSCPQITKQAQEYRNKFSEVSILQNFPLFEVTDFRSRLETTLTLHNPTAGSNKLFSVEFL